MYDVLPQTGRFSKTVIAAPYVARWFDIKDLTNKLTEEAEKIALKLAQKDNNTFKEEIEKIDLNLAQTHNFIFIERVFWVQVKFREVWPRGIVMKGRVRKPSF